MQNIVKLVILGHFLSFYTPKKSKNQNFEKWKNFLEILSFYTVYQKSQSFMMYGSWDRVRETELFVILDHFLPLYPPNNLKNQNFGKMEISFSTSILKLTIIWCMVTEIQSETDRMFHHFGPFFALLSPFPPSPPPSYNDK